MQKIERKGLGLSCVQWNVLSLLNLRSIWTGKTSSAAASAFGQPYCLQTSAFGVGI